MYASPVTARGQAAVAGQQPEVLWLGKLQQPHSRVANVPCANSQAHRYRLVYTVANNAVIAKLNVLFWLDFVLTKGASADCRWLDTPECKREPAVSQGNSSRPCFCS